MSKNNNSNFKFNIIVIILIAIFCIANTPITLQNDTFYTIKVGEQIVDNGITMQDTFSWHENLPYEYPHWAYDVMIYYIYSIGGLLGIYISTIIFSIILSICIYKINLNLTKNKITSLIVTLMSIIVLREFITARAQLITYILFICAVYCIEKFLENKQKRYALGLILISVIIANIHVAVWPFLFILFLPYIGEEIVYKVIQIDIDKIALKKLIKKKSCDKEKINKLQESIKETKDKKDKKLNNLYKIRIGEGKNIKYLILVMIICAFMGVITPLKDTPYTHLYNLMSGNSMQHIIEHFPTVLADKPGFLVLLVIYIAMLTFTKAKIRLRDLFMLGGLLLLSLIGQRQIALFVIITSIILNKLVCDVLEKHNNNLIKIIEKAMSNFMGGILLICVALIMNYYTLQDNLSQPMIKEEDYPVQASEFILNNIDLKTARLYNDYDFGSYLLYRGIPVFIDSRCDLYTPEMNGNRDIFMDYINISSLKEDYKQKFEEYGITHAILYNNELLRSVIKMDENYKLIYEDENFCLYEHT